MHVYYVLWSYSLHYFILPLPTPKHCILFPNQFSSYIHILHVCTGLPEVAIATVYSWLYGSCLIQKIGIHGIPPHLLTLIIFSSPFPIWSIGLGGGNLDNLFRAEHVNSHQISAFWTVITLSLSIAHSKETFLWWRQIAGLL